MRLLVIDGSSDAGDQRSPGILPPDAFQPFLRRWGRRNPCLPSALALATPSLTLVLVSDEPSMGEFERRVLEPSFDVGMATVRVSMRSAAMGVPRQIPMRIMCRNRITATAANGPWLVSALLIDLMAGPQRRIHAAMRRGDCPIGRHLANRTRSGRMALAHRSPVRERAMFSAFIGVEWHSSHRSKAGRPRLLSP